MDEAKSWYSFFLLAFIEDEKLETFQDKIQTFVSFIQEILIYA